MGKTIQTEFGIITVAEDVMAMLAGTAAVECYGVLGMASRRLKDGLAELLGQDNLRRGVEIKVRNNSVIVNLYIIVGYGVKVSEVAQNVMEAVEYTFQDLAGLEVEQVNVKVQGVRVHGEARG